MQDWISVVFGGSLIIIGLGFLNWHLKQPSPLHPDDPLTALERVHLKLRLRRRVQIAMLIIVIGLMVALGDANLIPWQQFQRAFALYWIAVLGLTFWLALLAIIDWFSVRIFQRTARNSLARLNQQQLELQQLAEDLRSRSRNAE